MRRQSMLPETAPAARAQARRPTPLLDETVTTRTMVSVGPMTQKGHEAFLAGQSSTEEKQCRNANWVKQAWKFRR